MFRHRFLLLFPLLILAGCSTEPETEPEERFTFQYERYERQHPSCPEEGTGGTEGEQTGCIELGYTWPEVSGGPEPLADSLTSSMAEFIFEVDTAAFSEQHFDSLTSLWFSMYDSVLTRIDNYSLDWEEQKMVSVIYDTPRLVSLEYYAYQFAGGAHPTTERYYRIFDKQTGERIRFADLFDGENEGVVTILTESRFRQKHDIPLDASLSEYGFWFEERGFYIPDNLALVSDGLLVHYNPYEVAPYSEGPTRLVLPWTEIDSLVSPRFRSDSLWQQPK